MASPSTSPLSKMLQSGASLRQSSTPLETETLKPRHAKIIYRKDSFARFCGCVIKKDTAMNKNRSGGRYDRSWAPSSNGTKKVLNKPLSPIRNRWLRRRSRATKSSRMTKSILILSVGSFQQRSSSPRYLVVFVLFIFVVTILIAVQMSDPEPLFIWQARPAVQVCRARTAAVRTIFSRLYNGESTAIVGEPHIGKSSILSYIADREIQASGCGERAAKYHFAEIDCHMIPRQFSPADFWSHTLADVPHVVSDDAVARQWQAMRSSQFGSFTVKRFFESVERLGWCVVLMIDEFDVLVNHPNFDGEFFGALRSLAIHTNALAVITASRKPVAEMNRQSLELNPYGSPFFNNFAEVRLIPLSPAECRA